jgi:PKD repeat protein
MRFNNTNWKIFLFVLTPILLQGQTWPIFENDDPLFERINCTAGEIHDSGGDHFHLAIDIDVNTSNCPFYPIANGRVYGVGGISVSVEHNYPVGSPNYFRRSRYLHVNPGVTLYQQVAEGTTQLGEVSNSNPGVGGHLHLEMWERIDGSWYKLDPFDNDRGWAVGTPVDNFNPVINDVLLQPVTDPPGTISGFDIIQSPINAISEINTGTESFVNIHFENSYNNIHPIFSHVDDKLAIFGTIGPIVVARDLGVTTDDEWVVGNGAYGGLTVNRISYLVNNQLRYRIDFDRIYDDNGDTDEVGSVFHVGLNAHSGHPRLSGNHDFIELRRLQADNRLFVHKPINNIHSNGLWNTRARVGTPAIFENTPTILARSNEEALFKDGKHDMRFESSDSYGNLVDVELPVIVDNFLPYIKEVKLTLAGIPIYNRKWVFDSNINSNIGYLQPVNVTCPPLPGFPGPLSLIISASESLNENSVSVALLYDGNEDGLGAPTSISPDKKTFTYLLDMNGYNVNDYTFKICGEDLAGNALLELQDLCGPNYPCLVAIPQRVNGEWDESITGCDEFHTFSITGCISGGNFVSNENTERDFSEGCAFADFTYEIGYDGQTVDFTDQSYSESSSITSWKWTFGDGAVSGPCNCPNPAHYYNESGSYMVRLEISDNEGNESSVEKQVILPEQTYGDELLVIINAPAETTSDDIFMCDEAPIVTVDQEIIFSGQAFGGVPPYSFSWDFGNLNGAQGAGPHSVVYINNSGFDCFLVTLTVVDFEGITETAELEVRVVNNPGPVDISWTGNCVGELIQLEADPPPPFEYSGIVNYTWDIIGPSGSTQYPYSGIYQYHTFTEVGTYDIIFTIEDANGIYTYYEQIDIIDCENPPPQGPVFDIAVSNALFDNPITINPTGPCRDFDLMYNGFVCDEFTIEGYNYFLEFFNQTIGYYQNASGWSVGVSTCFDSPDFWYGCTDVILTVTDEVTNVVVAKVVKPSDSRFKKIQI